MHRKLLDVLVDPLTGDPLQLAADSGVEPIEAGELVSPSGARYPIVRGIPRFVQDHYAESFGYQWNLFSKVQLDSANGGSYSRRRFNEELQWDSAELKGKWVVDAGCGAGRFSEIAASYGAEVLAVDLSSAVDATAQNLAAWPNVHPIQADITRLPLRRDQVSFLYSIGVIQHTPDPVTTTRRLVQFLGPGARFGFTIYGRRPWTLLHSKYLIRPLTSRLTPERLLGMIRSVMPVMFRVTSILFSLPLLGPLARFIIPIANYTWQKDLPREIRYQQSILDTFDMLSPRYDRPLATKQVQRALVDLASDLRFVSRVPIIVSGVRR